jgi:hypothetical protein
MAALVVVSASPASATSETCFGYTGNFTPPTTGYPTFQYVSFWPGPNCFGITADRRIWITAAGHPWSVIPGGGLADGLPGYRYDPLSGGGYGKTVQVYVKASGNFYCQTWWSDTNWVGHWTLCNGGIQPN